MPLIGTISLFIFSREGYAEQAKEVY